MANEYYFIGSFKIVTDCPDVDVVARVLNETAKQFGDIMSFNSDGEQRGYMWIYNDLEIEIPINDRIGDEEESEIYEDEE